MQCLQCKLDDGKQPVVDKETGELLHRCAYCGETNRHEKPNDGPEYTSAQQQPPHPYHVHIQCPHCEAQIHLEINA